MVPLAAVRADVGDEDDLLELFRRVLLGDVIEDVAFLFLSMNRHKQGGDNDQRQQISHGKAPQ